MRPGSWPRPSRAGPPPRRHRQGRRRGGPPTGRSPGSPAARGAAPGPPPAAGAASRCSSGVRRRPPPASSPPGSRARRAGGTSPAGGPAPGGGPAGSRPGWTPCPIGGGHAAAVLSRAPAADGVAVRLDRDPMRDPVQPAAKRLPARTERALRTRTRNVAWKASSTSLESVRTTPADGHDHRAMCRHEGGERRLVAAGDEPLQQLRVRQPRDCPLAEQPADMPEDGLGCSFAMSPMLPTTCSQYYTEGAVCRATRVLDRRCDSISTRSIIG